MSELDGPVGIVGCGLIGTSLGLALHRAGIEVVLSDASSDNVRTATGMGAGRAMTAEDRPQLVVVAVPPHHLGHVIREWLEVSSAVVTDVGSVKSRPLAAVSDHDGVNRYVGGHPMAGSERSGPLAASAALFDGRPWAVTPHDRSDATAVELVESLATLSGALPVRLTPQEHDAAVARTSHLPHLLAALVAGQLLDAPTSHLTLSGQGLRDVTRVAAGDPELYGQIVSANGDQVLPLLLQVRESLDAVIQALGTSDQECAASRCSSTASPGPGRSRASTEGPPARPARCSCPCPTTPASWPGCSRTRARARSTSRTCVSTTTPVVTPAWSSWWSRRTAPSTC